MVSNEQIRKRLQELGLLPEGAEIGARESLFDNGIMDSLAMMSVTSHLESFYRITIAEEDLLPENFDTVESIAQYVTRRRKLCA